MLLFPIPQEQSLGFLFLADSYLRFLNDVLTLFLQDFSILDIFYELPILEKEDAASFHTLTLLHTCKFPIPYSIFLKNLMNFVRTIFTLLDVFINM